MSRVPAGAARRVPAGVARGGPGPATAAGSPTTAGPATTKGPAPGPFAALAPDSLRRRSLGGPAARSLLLTVLGEFVLDHAEPVWNAALVRSLVALGIREVTARQAVTRSAAEGWLERDRVGRQARWRLSAPTRDLLVRGRERIYNFEGVASAWDGRWLVVMVRVPEGRRDHRHQVRTRLAWAGFGSLGQGLWISPRLEREREALDALRELGTAAQATSFVASHGGIGDERELVVAAWGGLDRLDAHYRAFLEAFEDLEPKGAAERFVAQARMVHQWRKFPFIDPGLPRPFLPEGWSGVRAGEVFRDRHQRWAEPARAWFREGNG
jgi:phenylacetic acid degradation operon negative regulatory protein